jgi:hypothetical protein
MLETMEMKENKPDATMIENYLEIARRHAGHAEDLLEDRGIDPVARAGFAAAHATLANFYLSEAMIAAPWDD